MKFVKAHSYEVFKMIVIQIGMAIFGLVLSLAANQNDSVLLILSIFSSLFYMGLIYTMMWELGAKDGVKCRARHIDGDLLTGTKISLCSGTLNIVIAVMMVIGSVIAFNDGGNTPAIYNLFLAIGGIFEAMYLGIIKFVVTSIGAADYIVSTIMYCITVLPAIVSSTIGYILGYKEIRLFGKFYSSNSNK